MHNVKRTLLLILLIAGIVGANRLFHSGNSTTATAGTSNTSVGAVQGVSTTDASASPGAGGSTTTGAASPQPASGPAGVASPSLNAGDLVAQMSTRMGNAGSMHVQFTGRDVSGPVSFDVQTDGIGGLWGTYSRGGATAGVIVANNVLYIQGGTVATSYSGDPYSQSVTGWIAMPAWAGPGMLGTLSADSKLETCLQFAVANGDGYQDVPQKSGSAVRVVQRVINRGLLNPYAGSAPAWEFKIAASGPADLYAWHYVDAADTAVNPPACNNGVDDTGTPASGLNGDFTFSEFGAGGAAPGAPAGATPLDPGDDPTHT